MKKSLTLTLALPLALSILMLSTHSAMAADVSGDTNTTLNPATTSSKAPVQTDTQSKMEIKKEVEVKTEQTRLDQSSQSETKAEPTNAPEANPSKSSHDELENETKASGSSSTNIQKLFSTFQQNHTPQQVEANAPINANGQLPAQK
jgi:hypothetical protein